MLKKILFFLIISAIYILISFSVKGSIFKQTDFSYYNYLANSFIHGRTYIIPQNQNQAYDMSFYKNKIYMYWGPSPILFILPFYLFGRIYTSDVLYTLIAGILNVVIFYFLLKEAIKFFKLKLSDWSVFFVVSNFALASPNFYLSLGGKIWHTTQVIGILYLLLFLLFFFKFLNSKSKIILTITLFFYGLAVLSRQTVAPYLLLFIYPFMILRRIINIKKYVTIFIPLTLAAFILIFFYNFIRFENPFENGMRYQVGNSRFNQLVQEGKLFSLSYIPHNIQYTILNPLSFSTTKPFMKWDPEGNSIFMVYPLLIALFFFIKSKIKKEIRPFLIISAIVVFLVLSAPLTFLGTGWFQFGARYYFDAIPLLFLLTIFIVERVPIPLRYFIIVFGTAVNLIGALTFPWLI